MGEEMDQSMLTNVFCGFRIGFLDRIAINSAVARTCSYILLGMVPGTLYTIWKAMAGSMQLLVSTRCDTTALVIEFVIPDPIQAG